MGGKFLKWAEEGFSLFNGAHKAVPPPNWQIPEGKWDYMFGRVEKDPHNTPRSIQNELQFHKIGIDDTPEGRQLIADSLKEAVSSPRHRKEVFSNQYGTFEVRESLLAGPHGFLMLESTWIVLPDGTLSLSTIIPKG
ncbi:hypothetical protein ACQPW3_22355 [Actinosynnema sp. CA-248983]